MQRMVALKVDSDCGRGELLSWVGGARVEWSVERGACDCPKLKELGSSDRWQACGRAGEARARK